MTLTTGVSAQADFACPDDRARGFYEMARNPGGSDVETWMRTFRYVIEHAVRPMDDRALHTACARLAYQLHRQKYSGPDYVEAWPPLTDLRTLVADDPLLERCPRYAINTDTRLPIRRVWVAPPRAVIDGAITGWVRLELVVGRDGAVDDARVRWSSHPLLETPALASAMQFRFAPPVGDDGAPARLAGVLVTHTVDYWSLARLAGCQLE